jgi:hypothetical protein
MVTHVLRGSPEYFARQRSLPYKSFRIHQTRIIGLVYVQTAPVPPSIYVYIRYNITLSFLQHLQRNPKINIKHWYKALSIVNEVLLKTNFLNVHNVNNMQILER